MGTTSKRFVICLSSAALVAGCGSTHSHVVRVTGRIGPLQVDRSDQAAVVAFAGRPDRTSTGSAAGGYMPYRALGYDCDGKGFDAEVQIVGGCKTVFFLDRRSGKLETFSTSSSKYSEGHGVRIGMTQAEAERRLHKRLTIGCSAALHFESPSAALSIDFAGGLEHGSSIKGAHVDAFVLHSHRRDAGVFDCL